MQFDYEICDEDDDYGNDDYIKRYKIVGSSGESRIWNYTSPYCVKNDLLFEKLVPIEGKAKTKHGELLRCMNRLFYDIFNNDLCNNKSEEIHNLIENKKLYRSFLKEPEQAMNFLFELRSTHESYYSLEMDQANCDALDDIAEAVIQYVAQEESK